MNTSITLEQLEEFAKITKFLREHIDFSKNPIPLVVERKHVIEKDEAQEKND